MRFGSDSGAEVSSGTEVGTGAEVSSGAEAVSGAEVVSGAGSAVSIAEVDGSGAGAEAEEQREGSIGWAKSGRRDRHTPGRVTNPLSHRPQAEKERVRGSGSEENRVMGW